MIVDPNHKSIVHFYYSVLQKNTKIQMEFLDNKNLHLAASEIS